MTDQVLEQFRQRCDNRPAQIDNSKLYAGSPMYYYCKACGHVSDILPEAWWIERPKKLCEPCQELEDSGLLPVAV